MRASAARAIRGARSVLVVSHVRPDGDSVGSSLALWRVLKKGGKKPSILAHDPVPRRFSFLPDGASWRTARAGRRRRAELVVALDSTDVGRLGDVRDLLPRAPLLNIDHHVSNGLFGEVNWVEPEKSSVSEMLVELFEEAGLEMDRKAAECLCAGIVTDTGRFSYSNATPSAMRAVAGLVERFGVDLSRLNRMLYSCKSRGDLELERRARASLRAFAGGRAAEVRLTIEDFRRAGASPLDAQEISQITMQPAGTEVGLYFYEVDGGKKTRVGVRSSGRFDAASFARKFGGGGHRAASGFSVERPLEETGRLVKRELVKLLRR